ncbi:MAG: PAS domain-containing protein [Burkholderiales bacterium]|nr:PAS domain-containing protein [Burkholderiales bacterium]
MRLSKFILANLEAIFQEWEDFANTLVPPGQLMGKIALRDHIKPMLEVIAADLVTPESRHEEIEKSTGNNNSPTWKKTAATTHGIERLAWGFSLDAAVAEYRALRASVMRMWKKSLADDAAEEYLIDDLIRFNEAIDQAINESVTSYTYEKAQQMRIFDAILSFMPDISFTLTLEGRLSYANKAFAILFSSPANELVGKNFVDLGLANGAELQQYVDQVIESKKPSTK